MDAATGASLSHITKNGERVPGSAKGFICPVGQVCVEADSNPEDGVQSFDNIFASMMQVVIVISCEYLCALISQHFVWHWVSDSNCFRRMYQPTTGRRRCMT